MTSVDLSLCPTSTGAAARLAASHADERGLKLYGAWFCPFVQRVWITLCEKSIDYQYVEISPYRKEPSLLQMNPRGLVPALAVPPDAAGNQPKPLFESTVIFEYLDEAFSDEAKHGAPLLPSDPYERARARLWIDHVCTRIVPAFYKLLQHTPDRPYGIDSVRDELRAHVEALVGEMDPAGPWFLGGRISLVDISLAPWAKRLWLIDRYKPGGKGFPPSEGESGLWARWRAWMEAMENRQSIKDTSSDDESYFVAYRRYAEDTTGSLVGQATRQGQGLQ